MNGGMACGARRLNNSAAATHKNVHEPEVDEPEDPDVDEPLDEVDELLLVEDVDVLSDVEDVPEEAAGLAPSLAGFLA